MKTRKLRGSRFVNGLVVQRSSICCEVLFHAERHYSLESGTPYSCVH